ncbi:MAG: lipoyl(octanoyl) transferase LipB [Pseudomonadota bacterium]|nr:lipoyl(octanoyl) transferase LipB [Pseudomonadota bacterium]
MIKKATTSVRYRIFRHRPYEKTCEQMRNFTLSRNSETKDEVWFLDHLPVFTIGKLGKLDNLLSETKIPVAQSDRGGDVTYHGPGQLVVYLLLDLARRNLGVRQLVSLIEDTLICLLSSYGISASTIEQVPGVFVGRKKIGFLGLRIRSGKTYHGFSLNIDMDLTPFRIINPCGYEGLEVTDLKELGKNTEMKNVVNDIKAILDLKLSKLV